MALFGSFISNLSFPSFYFNCDGRSCFLLRLERNCYAQFASLFCAVIGGCFACESDFFGSKAVFPEGDKFSFGR